MWLRTALAITSKDGGFGVLAVSEHAAEKELTRLDEQPNRRPLKRVAQVTDQAGQVRQQTRAVPVDQPAQAGRACSTWSTGIGRH